MPRIPARLPVPLSERIATATQNIYSRQGREVDVAIGGIPFRLATSAELPHTIETIPIRKEQVDTETDPGEQSLAGWWRRAQASWHEGAGFLYQENIDNLNPGNGFYDSRGVDVFTRGQITLLKKMLLDDADVYSKVHPAVGANMVATVIKGGDLCQIPDVDWVPVVFHDPIGVDLNDGIALGTEFYSVGNSTLFAGTVASPGTATDWVLTGDGGKNLMWGKHRLWVYGDNVIYQPDLTVVDGGNQDPIFTHPSAGFTYKSAAEGPSAMYFAGDDGLTASIQAITLEADGGIPVLSGATTVATLPDGEYINSITTLGGFFMGIGTSEGFRVGLINADATITYGPLLFEDPVGYVGAQGQYFIACAAEGGVSSTPLAYRVDTGNEIEDLVFPYAADIEASAGEAFSSVCSVSGRRLLATTSTDGGGVGFWHQSDTEFVDSAYIQSGRIRYRTTERKFYRSLMVEIEPLNGNVSIDLIREGGSTQALGNLTTQGTIREDSFLIDGGAMRYASVKFTFVPTGDNLAAPVLNAYQLTAYPAVAPQRLITLPLLCFDREQAKSGQWYGGEGFAVDRLTALQTIENEGELVTYQDFTLSSGAGQMVMIERARFVQTSSVSSRNSVTGPGGILVLELRTVDGT